MSSLPAQASRSHAVKCTSSLRHNGLVPVHSLHAGACITQHLQGRVTSGSNSYVEVTPRDVLQLEAPKLIHACSKTQTKAWHSKVLTQALPHSTNLQGDMHFPSVLVHLLINRSVGCQLERFDLTITCRGHEWPVHQALLWLESKELYKILTNVHCKV